MGFPGGASGKEPAYQCRDIRDAGSTPESGRSPGGGHGKPLQYSCLENPMDRGAWWATVYGVTQSWTRWKLEQQQHLSGYKVISQCGLHFSDNNTGHNSCIY